MLFNVVLFMFQNLYPHSYTYPVSIKFSCIPALEVMVITLLVLMLLVPLVTMNPDDFFGLQILLHREREPRIDRLRVDPRETMSDPEFIRHYRFR